MRNLHIMTRAPLAAVAAAALIALSGCGEGDRSAEAETPVSEAEVSTELPESVVSDEQLEATANAAAEIAGTPPAQVIPVPVGTGGQAGATAGQATATNSATTTVTANTTDQ